MKKLLILLLFSGHVMFAQEMQTIQVRDNLYMVGDRTYSLFYITNTGVVVIDPINKDHAAHTLEEIKKVTDKPVTHVFYSHNHWDHISGANNAFSGISMNLLEVWFSEYSVDLVTNDHKLIWCDELFDPTP